MSGPEDEPGAGGSVPPPGSWDGRGGPGSRKAVIAAAVAVAVILAVILATVGYVAVNRILDDRNGSTVSVERRVSVFFCAPTSSDPGCGHRDATEREKQAVRSRLEGMPEVRRIEYESKEQAYERFKRTFRDREDMLQSVRPGDIADSLQLRVTGTEAAGTVKAATAGLPGVDSVVIQPHSTRA